MQFHQGFSQEHINGQYLIGKHLNKLFQYCIFNFSYIQVVACYIFNFSYTQVCSALAKRSIFDPCCIVIYDTEQGYQTYSPGARSSLWSCWIWTDRLLKVGTEWCHKSEWGLTQPSYPLAASPITTTVIPAPHLPAPLLCIPNWPWCCCVLHAGAKAAIPTWNVSAAAAPALAWGTWCKWEPLPL